MKRTPLRPLARILDARAKGENPDAIERENRARRNDAIRDKSRARTEVRLLLLGLSFLAAFGAVGARMGMLAASEPAEPKASVGGAAILAQRADIVDRRGQVLATNLVTHSLYAQPHTMIDPVRAADELARIFPDLDRERLLRDFTGKKKFVWIRKRISPEQMQLVHDIGDPGLLFGPREMRLYPNGAIAAHILGGASFGREGVASAEVVGVAGVEKTFDGWLRDPANNGAPLRLSLDLTVQSALEDVLDGGMKVMTAKGAAGILMDVHTGEVVAMASLPDFDPNDRPAPLLKGDASDTPLFNRAVQGTYELGSTFKIFAVAQALELGLVTPDTMVNSATPWKFGRHTIRDFHNYGAQLSVTDVIVESSNVGTGHIALMLGKERQQAFLRSLGLFEPVPFEMVEAATARPMVPKNWADISTVTVSYGHGLSASPLHLAAAYASIITGHKVTPTLLANPTLKPAPQIISPETAAAALKMMRMVVTDGTATFANVPGYEVAGKTGTADKARPQGGYYKDKVIATFAGVFPASDPKYVLIVSLDEPQIFAAGETRRTGGWTAAPVAAEVITRIAPLLGLRPKVEQPEEAGVTLVSN